MTQIITASAPGKIHFLGEHTAVYGQPALLASIDKRCTVSLTPTKDPSIHITSKNFNKTIAISFDEVFEITQKAHEQWKKYIQANDIAILKAIVKDPVTYSILAIGETLLYFDKKPETGFHLIIDSQIPLGSGHGSSAAVAVSVVGAVTKFLGELLNEEVISKIAIKVEQKKHGNPSYGDVGTVLHGGLIWFQKETPEKILIEPLDFEIPKKLTNNLLIMQSGEPAESTGEMMHAVAGFKKAHPEKFAHILHEQGNLTQSLIEVLRTADEERLLEIMQKGERNLETIGVVSEKAKDVIRTIEQSGGAAKICGAGGYKNGSGIILAYHKNRSEIEAIAKTMGLEYYTILLGGNGLRVE